MSFKQYIRNKLLYIMLIIFGVSTIEILLIPYNVALIVKIYIPLVIIGLYIFGVIFEYITKNKYYSNLNSILEYLDEKYLANELIKSPSFIEGKILKSTLDEIDKSMHENVNKYKYMQNEYKEYIELWVHEIKMPIATSKLIIENNRNSATKSIEEELDKIEDYVEQVLFYARSNNVEKDYYIRKNNIKHIVNETIKKNKNILMNTKTSLNIHDVEEIVNTDSKWIVFILTQIIQNSVKYKKENVNLELEIYAKKQKENTILYIKDNGIGIKENEVAHVIEKGFTGTNGRISNKKSTGIGLYLSSKLCEKMGIGLIINSKEEVGTEVGLIFPHSSYIDV